MHQSDYFAKLKFSDKQLSTIKDIYYKYFHSGMPMHFTMTGVTVTWDAEVKHTEERDKVAGHVIGFDSIGAAADPGWQEFETLLPFMSKVAVITKIPAGRAMHPHVDRTWRPQAIYFPIDGSTAQCESYYYDIPKDSVHALTKGPGYPMFTDLPNPPILHKFNVHGNAYLTNVQEFHGLKNLGDSDRIALGWNFDSNARSYDECCTILRTLGYL